MICWEVNETLVRKAQKQTSRNYFLFSFYFFLIFSQGLSFARLFKDPLGKIRWELHGKLSFPLSSDIVCPHSRSRTESSETFWQIPFKSSRLGCCLFKAFTQIWERILHRDNTWFLTVTYFFLILTHTQGLCNYLRPSDFSATWINRNSSN